MKKLFIVLSLFFSIPSFAQHSFNFDPFNINDTLIEHTFDTVVLNTGTVYTMQVEGTYSIWAPSYWSNPCGTIENSPIFPSPAGNMTGPVSCDMKYFFSFPILSLCDTANFPIPTERMEISLDNGQTWFHPVSTEAFNLQHIYNFQIVGMGYPIGIRQYSNLNSDDYGILKFSFTSEPTSVTSQSISAGKTNLFPNPATNRIYLENSKSEITQVVLRNSRGQTVAVELSKEEQQMLDVEHLPRGVYILEIQTKEKTESKTIILH